jgi:arginine N-succinyltransferase
MSFVVRAATKSDLQAIYEMAKLTGGGFTNLPPDKPALAAKLERSAAAFAREGGPPADELFVLVLEDSASGEVRGTAQLVTKVGQSHPFNSYRMVTEENESPELGRTVRAQLLVPVTDLAGSSEVGGLFLHPAERAAGLGLLLARSRYLFIAMHRARFAERILAELRGIIDERGGSPFWDAVGGQFFGMGFQQADHFNAMHGSALIAGLMPRHPLYVAMLPASARSAIALPHPSGRAAMRMLEAEGFAHEGYVDLFDGGPTMTARTDELRSVRDARALPLDDEATEGEPALLARGTLAEFRCCYGERRQGARIALDPASTALLHAEPGDMVWGLSR